MERLVKVHSKIKAAVDDSLDAICVGDKQAWLKAIDNIYEGLRDLKKEIREARDE